MSLRLPRESTLDDDDKELQLDGDHGSGWATWYGNEELLDKDENEEVCITYKRNLLRQY